MSPASKWVRLRSRAVGVETGNRHVETGKPAVTEFSYRTARRKNTMSSRRRNRPSKSVPGGSVSAPAHGYPPHCFATGNRMGPVIGQNHRSRMSLVKGKPDSAAVLLPRWTDPRLEADCPPFETRMIKKDRGGRKAVKVCPAPSQNNASTALKSSSDRTPVCPQS